MSIQVNSNWRSFALQQQHSQHNNSSVQQYSKGFAIEEGSSLMHKLPQPETKKIDVSKLDNPAFKEELMSPAQVREHMLAKAEQKDIRAIAYIDGKPAMMLGEHITSRNFVSNIAVSSKGDHAAALNALQEKYGSRLRIEKFAAGNGPTHAEAFELFNGRSYTAFVNEQYESAMQSRLKSEHQQLQNAQKALEWKNTPINAVFKVDGQIVASLGEDNTANIHTPNFLRTLDNMGISRDAAQTLFADTTGKNVSAKQLHSFFSEYFTDHFSAEYPEGNSRPSRGDISAKAHAQYINQVPTSYVAE